jgi:hypothetical protein
MKKSDLKKIINEELRIQRKRLFESQEQPQPQITDPNAPVGLNPKKAQGIIAGAIKTLINSGALTGVDQTVVDSLTADLIKNLDISVKAKTSEIEDDKEEADSVDLDDEIPHNRESDELDDQNQYDKQLKATTSDAKEEEPEEGGEEEAPVDDMGGEDDMGGLFEVKDLKKIFK